MRTHCTVLCLALVLVASVASADDRTHVDVVRDIMQIFDDMLAVLEKVESVEGARAADKDLESLSERYAQLQREAKAMGRPPREQEAKLKKLQEGFEEWAGRLGDERKRIERIDGAIEALGKQPILELTRMRERAFQTKCANNLRQIALAFIMRRQDKGKFGFGPDAFRALVDEGYVDEGDSIYRCPSVKQPEGDSFHTDYETWKAGEPREGDSSVPRAWEKVGNHLDGVRNVAFLDGRVQSMSDEEREKLIAAAAEKYGLERP